MIAAVVRKYPTQLLLRLAAGNQGSRSLSLMLSSFKHLVLICSLPRRFQDTHFHIPHRHTCLQTQPDSYPSRLPMPNTIPSPQLHERVKHGLPFLDLAAPLHFTPFHRTLASRSWRHHLQLQDRHNHSRGIR